MNPTTQTTSPIVTSSSTIGIVYKNGIMLASDTLGSYGSMKKYKDVRRLFALNSQTMLGGSGDLSDYQYIQDLLKLNALESMCLDEGEDSAKEVWSFLRAKMYQRRNKFDPLWNEIVVAGYDEEKSPFIGIVDKIGTAYGCNEKFIATGFGSYMAIPYLRNEYRDNMEEGEARALLEDCMRMLFYRDCRAGCRIQIGKVEMDGDGGVVSEPYTLDTSWDSPGLMDLPNDGGW